MDDYKTIGNYYCNQNTIASTLLNSPFERSFTMKVGYSTGSSYPYQLYREFNTGIVAYRYFSTDSNKWTEFVYFSDDATLQLKMIPSELKTLSDVLVYAESMQYPKVEFFECSGSQYTGNFPNNQYNYGTGFILKRNAASMSVIAFSESNQYRPIINSIKSGSWEGWKYFDGTSAQ